jgi:hypothetical protein
MRGEVRGQERKGRGRGGAKTRCFPTTNASRLSGIDMSGHILETRQGGS